MRPRLPLALLGILALGVFANPAGAAERELRVCADPNNLPFSNQKGEGFENKIAELVAEELEAELCYTWWAQRRGFIRNTLNAGACDVVMGVPAGYELVETTAAYYRSAYVYVYRGDAEQRDGCHRHRLDPCRERIRQLRHVERAVGLVAVAEARQVRQVHRHGPAPAARPLAACSGRIGRGRGPARPAARRAPGHPPTGGPRLR